MAPIDQRWVIPIDILHARYSVGDDVGCRCWGETAVCTTKHHEQCDQDQQYRANCSCPPPGWLSESTRPLEKRTCKPQNFLAPVARKFGKIQHLDCEIFLCVLLFDT